MPYPVYSTAADVRLAARSYHRIVLTAAQMRVVNDDLSGATLSRPKGAACTALPWLLVVKMVKPGDHGPLGEQVEMRSRCTERLDLQLYHLSWLPTAGTQDLLTSLIPKD